ncbi:MAG: hypothetical protein AB8B69_12950 [Chitinophagales bacterium]
MKKDNFIPLISNYCDRWCERCAFTTRCRVYASEAKQTDAEKDMENQVFWSRIGENFTKALEMLDEIRKELGLDPNHPSLVEEREQGTDDRRRILKTEHQKLTHQGTVYGREAKKWFEGEELERHFKEKGVEFQQLHKMGVSSVKEEVLEIQNALKVIQWYFFFISPKIQRALSGLEFTWGIEEDPIQNDANGSAKVALIAIQRSMGAWEILRTQFPDLADELIDFLVMLEKIKTQLTILFPSAAAFHRPGFDD